MLSPEFWLTVSIAVVIVIGLIAKAIR